MWRVGGVDGQNDLPDRPVCMDSVRLECVVPADVFDVIGTGDRQVRCAICVYREGANIEWFRVWKWRQKLLLPGELMMQ
jgi:hypothetical protein